MRLSNRIVFASLNDHKLHEFRTLLSSYGEFELVPAADLIRNSGQLGLVEKYNTYEENAAAKARLANMASHYPALADDSGLEVKALGNRPGPKSNRFSPPQPEISQDQANCRLLMSEMARLLPKDPVSTDRSARFVASLALMIEGILIRSTGVLEGSIAESPRGSNGFGYDPLFIPTGSSKTLAEMSNSEKNAISHRSKALQDLMAQVAAMNLVFAKP